MKSPTEDQSKGEIIKYLNDLSARIVRIENHLGISDDNEVRKESERRSPETTEYLSSEEKENLLELRIGQFWFAKVGIAVFFIGIAFLMCFPFSNIPVTASIVFGYLLSVSVFFLSKYWKETYPHLSGYLLGGGMFLFYFTTLRLKFFGSEYAGQIITDSYTETILLVISVVVNLSAAVSRKSKYLVLFGLTFGYATAILSESPFTTFTLLALMSILAVYFRLKFNWYPFIFVGMILTYSAHLFQFANNIPAVNNLPAAMLAGRAGLLFLLLYSVVFSFDNKIRKEQGAENAAVIYSSILNGVGSYGLFLLINFVIKYESAPVYNLLASITFISLAISFWIKEKSRYSTFIYAMLGYFALSVAIIYEFSSPAFFFLLCWQSVLVISTAVWFRSKFIILANFIIYIIIFITYLVMEGKVSSISLSFGIAALISARILNWKKDKLELKTEQMRSAYLLTALAIIPYALYHAMPPSLISVSWIGVAIIYYVLSIILKSRKYRWMSLLTLLLTVGYVFIIGVTNEDPTYKIISFLALGLVMLIISILYSKKKKSQTKTG